MDRWTDHFGRDETMKLQRRGLLGSWALIPRLTGWLCLLSSAYGGVSSREVENGELD